MYLYIHIFGPDQKKKIFTFLVVNFAHNVLKGLLFNNELNYLLIVLKDLCFFSVEISHIFTKCLRIVFLHMQSYLMQ